MTLNSQGKSTQSVFVAFNRQWYASISKVTLKLFKVDNIIIFIRRLILFQSTFVLEI